MADGNVSPEQRREWAREALEAGASFQTAADAAGVTKGTVSKWAKKYGWDVPDIEERRSQTEAAALSFAERRERLAHELLDDVEQFRRRLFAGVTIHRVNRKGEPISIDLDEPPPQDMQSLMTCIAIGVDKVQILTGAATQRLGYESSADPAKVAGLADELAAKRQAKAS